MQIELIRIGWELLSAALVAALGLAVASFLMLVLVWAALEAAQVATPVLDQLTHPTTHRAGF